MLVAPECHADGKAVSEVVRCVCHEVEKRRPVQSTVRERNGLCKQTAGLRKSFGANDFATVSDAVSSFACEGDGLREPRLPAGAFAAGLLEWAWA